MAITLIATIKSYQCLSSDDKPTPSEQPEGSKLHVINTGEKYIIHDGAWVPDLSLIYALSMI